MAILHQGPSRDMVRTMRRLQELDLDRLTKKTRLPIIVPFGGAFPRNQPVIVRMNKSPRIVAPPNSGRASRMNLMEKSLLGRVTKSRASGVIQDEAEDKPEKKEGRAPSTFSLPKVKATSVSLETSPSGRGNRSAESSTVSGSMSRIENALQIVKRMKSIDRDDRLRGVPKGFVFENSGVIIVEDDNNMKRSTEKRKKKKKKRGKKVEVGDSREEHSFKFPKDADFIREKTEISQLGVNWNVSLDYEKPRSQQCQRSQLPVILPQRPATQPANSQKQLMRLNSLKDGVQREGTSVERRKGRVLKEGDWNVMKVWPRSGNNLQPNVTPIEMANKDVPIYNKIKKMAEALNRFEVYSDKVGDDSSTPLSQQLDTEPSEYSGESDRYDMDLPAPLVNSLNDSGTDLGPVLPHSGDPADQWTSKVFAIEDWNNGVTESVSLENEPFKEVLEPTDALSDVTSEKLENEPNESGVRVEENSEGEVGNIPSEHLLVDDECLYANDSELLVVSDDEIIPVKRPLPVVVEENEGELEEENGSVNSQLNQQNMEAQISANQKEIAKLQSSWMNVTSDMLDG